MTVVDSSVLLDYLLRAPAGAAVERVIAEESAIQAPDVVVFEVLSALRRAVHRRRVSALRAGEALQDLGDLPMDLFPAMPLREDAWHLRENFSAADALFVALAEATDAPLATKDRGLAAAARARGVEVVLLGD